MDKMIKVNFRNLVSLDFPKGTTLLEISKSFQKYFNYPILIAKVDNDLVELAETIDKKCDVDFYDRSSLTGNGIYGRSLQFILIVAVKRVLGETSRVVIEHSIDKGFYCEIIGEDIDKPIVTKIEKTMKEIVKENLIFTKLSVSRLDSIKFFKKKNQMDKVNALKYISNTYINLYRLDDVYDYFYGELAYSTGTIDDFKLTYIQNNGFVVSYPDVYNPECTLEYRHHKMLFDAFLDYTRWGRNLNVTNASDLNQVVSTGDYNTLIQLSEAHYNSQLARIADEIANNRDNIKIVLIAGPSSSGKTTTAKKLEIYMRSRGLKTHQVSIDDYFLNRADTPKDENGDYDFESVSALDLDLLNKHMAKLADGEKVLLPEYNFVLGKREFKNHYLQLEENDVIIMEGLHALNEELTLSIPRKNKYKIYISPLTQLNIDNHNRIHTSDTRKLRRIVRDNKFRGYTAEETLKMWKKIREGEEKYVFPFQDEADALINSSLLYELGILKTYAEPLLFSVHEEDPMYPEAIRLINFLRNFLPIPSDDVPIDSVLREFIGGSVFHRK